MPSIIAIIISTAFTFKSIDHHDKINARNLSQFKLNPDRINIITIIIVDIIITISEKGKERDIIRQNDGLGHSP